MAFSIVESANDMIFFSLESQIMKEKKKTLKIIICQLKNKYIFNVHTIS